MFVLIDVHVNCALGQSIQQYSNKRKIVSFLPGKNIKRIKPLYVF